MEIVRKATVNGKRLAVLPGSFNPPTHAHMGLAEAALRHADEVLFTIPREFPHKNFSGATLEERIELLRASAVNDRYSIGIAEKGLFIEIARELHPHYPDTELLFVCGRDAAERIIGWSYDGETIDDMLREFGLLVADREGRYEPPLHLDHAITALRCESFDEISSTAVRERLIAGQRWEHLVPESIRDAVERIYRRGR